MLFFHDLWMLWFLAPIYLIWVGLFLWLPARFGSSAVRFSSLAQLQRLRPSTTVWVRRLLEGLRLITVALLLVAMVRPQTGRTLTEINAEGIDIVLVLDTSGSMQALDLDSDREISKRRNRLEVAKAVVESFIAGRDNDQIGLVVFGTEAFTQCPLTLDHGILATFLERVEIGMAGEGTAIGSAVGVAAKRLRDSEAKSKVIILLTDGLNNAGSLAPTTATEVAKTYGIKIYTIGAGAKGEAPFLVQTRLGPQVMYQDVEIDEETLTKMASATGGAYYRAEDEEALAGIYSQIDQLEKSEIQMESYLEYNEQYRWFVLPALGLLMAEVGLLGTRFRKLP